MDEKKATDTSGSAPNEVIRAEGVVKSYKDNGVPVKAVRGIDLTIERGEFTAIVGPSGSGKTTFLNIISGLDDLTSGRVWLNGRELSSMSGRELSEFRRDNIGFIFQAYNLIPVLTVAENAEYILLLQGMPQEKRRQRVHEVLKELGLDGFRRPSAAAALRRATAARGGGPGDCLATRDCPRRRADRQPRLSDCR